MYPLDAVFDKVRGGGVENRAVPPQPQTHSHTHLHQPEDVPESVFTNKRYAGLSGYTISEVADAVKADYGKIDILVHSLANGPEVTKPLLETSRQGYLAASSASAYSAVSLLQHFAPIMNPGGSFLR